MTRGWSVGMMTPIEYRQNLKGLERATVDLSILNV